MYIRVRREPELKIQEPFLAWATRRTLMHNFSSVWFDVPSKLYFQDDMSCPICGRIWRVPGPIPESQQAQVQQKSSSQSTTIQVHMCPNDWCSYYVQETPEKDMGKCRRLIHK